MSRPNSPFESGVKVVMEQALTQLNRYFAESQGLDDKLARLELEEEDAVTDVIQLMNLVDSETFEEINREAFSRVVDLANEVDKIYEGQIWPKN